MTPSPPADPALIAAFDQAATADGHRLDALVHGYRTTLAAAGREHAVLTFMHALAEQPAGVIAAALALALDRLAQQEA